MDAPPALKYTLEFDQSYGFDQLNQTHFARFVEERILTRFPEDTRPHLSIRLVGEPRRSADLEDTKAWLKALSSVQVERAELSVWRDGKSFRLNLQPLEKQLNVHLSLPEDEATSAQTLLSELQQALSLEPLPDRSDRPLISVSGEYVLARTAFQSSFATLLDQAATFCGTHEFWSEIRDKETYEVKQNYKLAEGLIAHLQAHPDAWTYVHAVHRSVSRKLESPIKSAARSYPSLLQQLTSTPRPDSCASSRQPTRSSLHPLPRDHAVA